MSGYVDGWRPAVTVVRTLAVTRGAALEWEGWRSRLGACGIGLENRGSSEGDGGEEGGGVGVGGGVGAGGGGGTGSGKRGGGCACLRAFWLARRARPTRELYLDAEDSPESSRD